MTKKRIKIKYTKERVVLSDVLPYETPLIFSNRYFYNFLVKNKIEIKNNNIVWKKDDDALNILIRLIFGLSKNDINSSCCKYEIKEKNKFFRTIPFTFKIGHKINDFRELSVIHPKNQIKLVDFYNNFKELIIYYSDVSPFSIRRPYKLAKFVFRDDYLHKIQKNMNQEFDSIEEADKEYETLKTFFTYKKYSNIYKFFESYYYQRCEKKYNELYKFDLSKCFDSIYTHSISWAFYNKGLVKANTSLSNKTFPGLFDRFMSSINYGETNGILIGPEFSRIFAELLLQQIDKKVYLALKGEEIYYKKHYEIFRYIDDYFIFYNSEKIKDKILECYKKFLREFKLCVGDSKTKKYNRPIITELTIAKFKISELINKYSLYLDNKIFGSTNEDNKSESNNRLGERYTYIDSKKIITEFKIIVKETKIEYKEILNYTIASLEKYIIRLLNKYSYREKRKDFENIFINVIIGILDFIFFIYLVSPEVANTIKLSSLLSILIKFVKNKNIICSENKHLIFKKIYNEIFIIFQKYKVNEFTQLETLYLLIALGELGREYRLESNVISNHFCLTRGQRKFELNYFSLTVLLFYIKNIKRYKSIRNILKKQIKAKLERFSKDNLCENTEAILLLLDVVSCPFLELNFKKNILKIFDIKKNQKEIINKQKYWFTKWSDFDYIKEIQAKKSQEVYN